MKPAGTLAIGMTYCLMSAYYASIGLVFGLAAFREMQEMFHVAQRQIA